MRIRSLLFLLSSSAVVDHFFFSQLSESTFNWKSIETIRSKMTCSVLHRASPQLHHSVRCHETSDGWDETTLRVIDQGIRLLLFLLAVSFNQPRFSSNALWNPSHHHLCRQNQRRFHSLHPLHHEAEDHRSATVSQRSDLHLAEQCNWQSKKNHSRRPIWSLECLPHRWWADPRQSRHQKWSNRQMDDEWHSKSPPDSFFA